MHASRKDIDATQFGEWYPLLSEVTIKSLVIPLDESFIRYLNSDGVKLPTSLQGYLDKDNISDDSQLKSVREEKDDDADDSEVFEG